MELLSDIKDYKVYGAGDVLDDILKFSEEGHQSALKVGIKEIDPHFSFRKGFILVTGYPGNGKSHWVDWVTLLTCKRHNLRACVYSPESYPVWEYVDHLVRIWTGKSTDPNHKERLTKEEITQAVGEVFEKFSILDFTELPSVDQLINAFEHVKADIYIVDPFNFLDDMGVNLTQHIKQSASKFKNFSTHRDASLILIEHPKEPDKQKDADENGNLKPPGLFNLYGGSMWRNKIDIGVTIHIDNYPNHKFGQDKVMFKSTKIKNQAIYGKPGEVMMEFDYFKQRYIINSVDYYEVSSITTPF